MEGGTQGFLVIGRGRRKEMGGRRKKGGRRGGGGRRRERGGTGNAYLMVESAHLQRARTAGSSQLS
jgi:hypothetical protein